MADDAEAKSQRDESTGEGLAQELIEQVSQLKQQLQEASARIEAMRRSSELQRALVQQRCIDLASELELAEQADAKTPGAAPVSSVVDQVRKQAPGLFRSSSSLTAAISASVPLGKAGEAAGLQHLINKARAGDRASLLLYLQARRDRQSGPDR
jgi:TolA-binding protein